MKFLLAYAPSPRVSLPDYRNGCLRKICSAKLCIDWVGSFLHGWEAERGIAELNEDHVFLDFHFLGIFYVKNSGVFRLFKVRKRNGFLI